MKERVLPPNTATAWAQSLHEYGSLKRFLFGGAGTSQPMSFRFPEEIRAMIDELAGHYGVSKVEILTTLIRVAHQETFPKSP